MTRDEYAGTCYLDSSRILVRTGIGNKESKGEFKMKKSLLARWAFLFVVTMILSGCLIPFWVEEEGHGGHGGRHDRGRGHFEERR